MNFSALRDEPSAACMLVIRDDRPELARDGGPPTVPLHCLP